MESPPPPPTLLLLPATSTESLGERIASVHRQLLPVAPQVDRVACALYDPGMDLLKTFVNSTRGGEPLARYEYRLADSPSLSELVRERRARVIDDIPAQLRGAAEHTAWVREMGYRSSYTVPLFHRDVFQGFLFFDSRQPAAFTPDVVEKLQVYVNLVRLLVSHELTTIQTLVGSVRLARDFAHLRDTETGTHLDRMSRYARLIAKRLAAERGLSDEFVEQVFLFAPLHDIGKVGIPDRILLKPGRFTPEERTVMMEHVVLGTRMIELLVDGFQLGTLAGIDVLRNIVAGHHEMLDGSGYPRGLTGDGVPLEARIVSVADIFDALTSRRTYKDAWDLADAFRTLDEMAAAGKLDRDCVAALRASRAEVEQVIATFGEPPVAAADAPRT